MASSFDAQHFLRTEMAETASSNDLSLLLEVLPAVVRAHLERSPYLDSLVEVILDYGRPAEARYRDTVERMPDVIVTEHDIDFVTKSIGEFGSDNRAGIERTLHRISAIRNRHAKVIGLTCRVGRAVEGTIDMIESIVRSGQSILLLGRPGIGKTTKLREIARVLADDGGMRVVIVDTSNEIGGDGDVPHPGIGSARRMQVRIATEQHQVMIEAVENHMPQVIVIDEIGTEAEAAASRTIAERGVQLIGTAHGQTLENLMLNPTLCDLVGGIQAVTLSDAEAARRGTQKTVLERKAPPTFDVVVELLDYDRLAVHNDVQKTVDMILRGVAPRPEIRVRTGAGVEVVQSQEVLEFDDPAFNQKYPSLNRKPNLTDPALSVPGRASKRSNSLNESRTSKRAEPVREENSGALRVYPYGINRTRLEQAIKDHGLNVVVAADISAANSMIIFRSTYLAKPKKLREISARALPTAVVRSNTLSHITEALEELINKRAEVPINSEEISAVDEVFQGIEVVAQTGKPYELSPRSGPVRKLQHKTAESNKIATEAVGQDPNRRIRILPIRLPA